MKQSEDTIMLPETLRELLDSPMEVKLAMMKHQENLTNLLAKEIMLEEVEMLAGKRYERNKPSDGRYSRWGTNPGSFRIDQKRTPVQVPRLWDKEEKRCHSLESYNTLHEGVSFNDQLRDAILLGLSTRDYERVAGHFLEGFGLSQSTVSREFQQRTKAALEQFERRSLAEEDFIGLWIDGKVFSKQQIVIALGLTMEGRKIPLSFVQSSTENSTSVKGLLQDIVNRGFTFTEGIYCAIDGSKALRKAVNEVFGDCVVIQRCQWHKRENVVGYLNETDKVSYRRKLQKAYQLSDYDEAKGALMEIHTELGRINRSAANSLLEGLEETLTLQKLGVYDLLGKSLKTTNCIENLNSQLNKYTKKVKYWSSSDQRHRWIAAGLLEIEQKMRRIDNWKHLAVLRREIKREIEERRKR